MGVGEVAPNNFTPDLANAWDIPTKYQSLTSYCITKHMVFVYFH